MPDTPDPAASALDRISAELRAFGANDEDTHRLLKAALALHSRQDKPVLCWDHVCDTHRDQRGRAVQPPPRDCPDCRFRDLPVCKHCECPHDEWPCPTYRAITAALTGKEAD